MPSPHHRSLFFALTLAAICCTALHADPSVAVLTKTANARVIRNHDHLDLSAVPGDLLLAGDSLEIPPGPQGSAEFTMCPASGQGRNFRLDSGRATFEATSVQGAVSSAGETAPCALPELDQSPDIAMLADRSLTSSRDVKAPAGSDLAKMNPADRATYEAATASARRNPADLLSRVTRVSLLRKYKLDEFAVGDLVSIADRWKDEQWARTLGYTIESAQAPPGPSSGTLYAALIGISNYGDKNIRGLQFANKDAELFYDFLNQARAGGFAQQRKVLKLIDGDAKYSAIQTVKNFFGSAKPGDSILLYIAAHGVGPGGDDHGYVVLYDTKLEANYQNSWSMDDIRQLFISEAARVNHVFLFVDTCHADRIGQIRTFQSSDAALGKAAQVVTDGKVLAMYASDPNGLSYESAKYGGGHGAFTFFLMRALNIRSTDPEYRDADYDGDGYLQPNELTAYVNRKVGDNTSRRQSTDQFSNIRQFALSTRPPGLVLPPCCGKSSATMTAKGSAAAASLRDPTAPSDSRGLEWTPPPALAGQAALEEESQQVLYKYIRGEESPPSVDDYRQGLAATERALQNAGGSLFLEARAEFFSGRIALFTKSYDDAIAHLEKAVRMDPASPYSYNALGMTLLELRRYEEARSAFEDAIRRAPRWAYPRHNLGLVYLQRGDYPQAVATYQQAEAMNPQYSYLPYNLGLIYQRLNDPDNAVAQYNLAFERAPSRAAPLVALGTLMAEHGRSGKARRYYEQATEVLASNPEREVLVNLRHNEAALDARSRGGLDRAAALWRRNIQDADYVPSRFALARALLKSAGKRHPDALAQSIGEYSELVNKLPANTQARIEYAGALFQARRIPDARDTLEDGIRAVEEEEKSTVPDPSLQSALARLNRGRNPWVDR